MASDNLSVGSTVYYEECRAVGDHGNPVYTAKELRITGETPRKWKARTVFEDGRAVGIEYEFHKRGGPAREARRPRGYGMTVYTTKEALAAHQLQRARDRWCRATANSLSATVACLKDPDLILKVAALVDFTPKEAPPHA